MDKITPEEKLLKLIENPGKGVGDLKIKRPFNKRAIFNLFSFKQLKANFRKLGRSGEKFKPFLLNIKFVNRGLAVVAVAMILFLAFDFIAGRPSPGNVYIYAKESKEPGREFEIRPLQNAVNLSDYQNLIDKRDIFHFEPVKQAETSPQAKDILMAEVAQIKLVGIIWSKSPQAMIEDRKENKTSLVNEGDAVGILKIKRILKDKVIVGYENEEYELL